MAPRLALRPSLALLLAACTADPARVDPIDAAEPADGGAIGGKDAESAGDGSIDGADAAASDGAAPDAAPPDSTVDLCLPAASHCVSALDREACVDTPMGRRWMRETCASGSGCVQGQCVAGGCSDECVLGATAGGRTCVLLDLTGSMVAPDPVGSMADRARAYRAGIVSDMLPSGGLVSIEYADPTLAQPAAIRDSYDSALWTGTYLLAESLRSIDTGSVEAKESVEDLVRTLHLWFNVSGYPGYLARYAESADNPPPLSVGWACDPDSETIHCGFVHDGETYDWRGATSRDQYQGVMTGLAVAYDAPIDESVRALIREDVVELVEELMIERTLPVEFRVDGISFTRDITSRYVVLNPSEMDNGTVVVEVSTGDIENSSDLDGVREFVPDLADVFRQLPILSWLPNIPRDSTTIMLHSFFLTALHTTEGVPGYAARREAIRAFYEANVDGWLDISLGWDYPRSCGRKYYATNIAFTPVYNVARLETDPIRRMIVTQDLIADTMWPVVSEHENAHFAFIAASALASPPAAAIAVGQAQTSLYPAPPRADVGVDSSSLAPQDPECTADVGAPFAAVALDVHLRPADMFVWQRSPWGMVGGGAPQHAYPGVDYVVTYWMGRRHGYLDDDREGTCARFD